MKRLTKRVIVISLGLDCFSRACSNFLDAICHINYDFDR